MNAKGSRVKCLVVDNAGCNAFFKYQGNGYLVSEACSEKMCYEIAKVLGYECARIELAVDNENILGVLNYLFVTQCCTEHIDAVSYLNIHSNERALYYTISNIKRTLDNLSPDLFKGFIRIMFFDALVGEQDRHEENWGIQKIGNSYKISPLYDNGCSLLRNFKSEEYARKYYDGIKDFDVAGTRYCSDIKKCKELMNINDKLLLEIEDGNNFDVNAIKVICVKEGIKYHLGYVPRYYSFELAKLLKSNVKYSAMICGLNFESDFFDEDVSVFVKLILNI